MKDWNITNYLIEPRKFKYSYSSFSLSKTTDIIIVTSAKDKVHMAVCQINQTL